MTSADWGSWVRDVTDRRAEIEAWAAAEVARRGVRAIADATRGLGTELLAFKGVHVAWCVADDPAHRPMRDADLLVLTGSFDHVVEHLVRTGAFRLEIPDWSTHGIRCLESGAYVDLHRVVLPPLWGRLRRRDLRRHAVRAEMFGPGVFVPDRTDAGVLALANWVKNGFGLIEPSQAPRDLALLADKGLRPAELRERLASYRLRRVGLIGMTVLAEGAGRWEPYRDALARGPREHALARRFVAAIRAAAARGPDAGLIVVRAVGDDFFSAAGSVAFGMARRVRDRARAWSR